MYNNIYLLYLLLLKNTATIDQKAPTVPLP